MRDSLFYEKMDNLFLKCKLCPTGCVIEPEKPGFCRVRKNIGGTLEIPYYGMISAISLDPIEKKPIFRYKPMTKILSIGGYSCNLRCGWCQNHGISMTEPELKFYSPELIADCAKMLVPDGNIGVAYTYNEPLIHFEYILDCAKKVKESGLDNILVTNGYINASPLRELLPYIDAMNIDLKGFSDVFYKNIAGGLECVKEIIEQAAGECHVEVTTLIIPEENDSPEEMEQMSKWMASVNPDIPLHLTRFFPQYKMNNKKPTGIQSIMDLKKIASKWLNYVYTGNIG